jgi:hypothetical protein
LRHRDGEAEKTASQRDSGAGHGPAPVATDQAERRFFRGAERRGPRRARLRGGVAAEHRSQIAVRDVACLACEVAKVAAHAPGPPNRCAAKCYFAEQGVGFQPAAPGSFLKSELVRYGRVK